MRSTDRWAYCFVFLGLAAVAVMAMVDPALALSQPPKGAPGPLIGVGLPVGAVVVAALIARHFRRND